MKGDPFSLTGTRRVFIFGHPAHELALFGLLQQSAPDVLIITDGGSRERIRQSQTGLASIGLEDKTTYLNFSEQRFYQALLEHDVGFFREVAQALEREIERLLPEQIFCDAVEFYNPVHDLTLPIVMRAARESISLFEVPLVYQTPVTGEQYRIQRWPTGQPHFSYELDDAELAAKMRALREIYLSLREQAGPEFSALTAAHLRVEEIAPAGDPRRAPHETGRQLRYEWRAQLLLRAGEIDEVITRADHFLPMVEALLSDRHVPTRAAAMQSPA